MTLNGDCFWTGSVESAAPLFPPKRNMQLHYNRGATDPRPDLAFQVRNLFRSPANTYLT